MITEHCNQLIMFHVKSAVFALLLCALLMFIITMVILADVERKQAGVRAISVRGCVVARVVFLGRKEHVESVLLYCCRTMK